MAPTEEKYILVKPDAAKPEDSTSEDTPGDAATEEELKPCPEILYKVQYKDFNGDIKGTKELTAPYKLKKKAYSDLGIPILEVLYSVTVWFPTIYKRGGRRGRGNQDEEDMGKKGKDGDDFDERSMEEKELIIHSEPIIKALRKIVDYYPGQSLLGNTISIKVRYSADCSIFACTC